MMTTSYVLDNLGNRLLDGTTYEPATVWDYGSGHVDPEKALDPGLVYDLTVDDYMDFLCASDYTEDEIAQITQTSRSCKKGMNPWDLNYPSVSVVLNQSSGREVLVTRTATQVSEGASTYTLQIENPVGVLVTVQPTKLEFSHKDQKLTYLVKILAERVDLSHGESKTEFGRMMWTDGKHVVSIPIAVTVSNGVWNITGAGRRQLQCLRSGSPVELKTCITALLEATRESWEEVFILAGLGGWKLHGIVKPNRRSVSTICLPILHEILYGNTPKCVINILFFVFVRLLILALGAYALSVEAPSSEANTFYSNEHSVKARSM
ncbi:hypothetical protein IFM89_030029 [Coptis chinensis]|uniref:Subtilisin-like protease fibronectin type-III domain-containing protein n=1 Tax=Coptis chinensis TaxID=261450 RepID=A0A835IQB7_9MAGN|nr:hypothetical protein IFM89_030029 [Coptis chinensis]